MSRTPLLVRAVVTGTTVALVGAGLAGPALADPPAHSNASPTGQQQAADNGNGTTPATPAETGKPAKPSKPSKPAKPSKPSKPAKPTKPSLPTATAQPTTPGSGTKPSKPSKPTRPPKPTKPAQPAQAGGTGDPAGNNGTVKIATLGELDGIPNNTPHPGCTFQVEWYGFDEGADVVSTVSFAMQAPTSDVGLSVDGPATVFVGGDPASGAGTDSGLDGTQTYTLGFDGEPHPQQGFHVRLTVSTPRSLGNDTKTKVFWVEPCAAEAAPAEAATTAEAESVSASGTDTGTKSDAGSTSETDASSTSAVAEGEDVTDSGVLGTQASIDDETASADDREAAGVSDGIGDSDAAVPTAVDAGEEGAFSSWVRSPWPLAVAGLGLLLTAGAVVLRRRHRA